MGTQVQARRLIAAALAVVLMPAMGWSQDDAADDAAAVDAAEVLPPELLQEVGPAYPADAMAADVEADVVLQIDIDVEGVVSNIVPLELVYYTYDMDGSAIEDPRTLEEDTYAFIPAAVEAMSGYLFAPARMAPEQGAEPEPIPVRVTWRVGFVIDYETIEVGGEVVDEQTAPPVTEMEPSEEQVAIDPDGPVNLAGTLLTRGTRVPLPGMLITVTSAADDTVATTTMSGEGGRFEVAGLPAGGWVVSVEESGFFPMRSEETVSTGLVTDVTYYVERNNYGDYVSTTVAEAPQREVTRRTLAVQEIQRIPGNNNDAIRVVQNLPGVARSQFNGGEVIVRGSEPGDTGFYLDGMRLPGIYHFGGLRAVVPTELLQDIDFYPGGFPVEFGRATGGVINVTTRSDLPEQTTGHVDVNLFDAGAFVRTPIGENFALELGARRSYIDAILSGVSDVIPLTFATAPRWYDYQARLTWKPNDVHTLRLLVLGSDDKVSFVLDDEDDLSPEFRGGFFAGTYFHGGIFSWDARISETLQHEMRLQIQWQSTEFTFGEDAYFDLDNRLFTFRDELTWTPSEQVGLRVGLDVEAYPGDIRLSLPRPPKEGEEPVNFDSDDFIEAAESFTAFQPGAYLAMDLAPVDGLQILPGVRGEYYEGLNRWGLDGRLAVRWATTDALTLKGSVSTHHQAPGFDEGSSTFGNPDLELESAIHYVLGTEVQILDHLSANVELFYKDMNNLVARTSESTTRDGEVVPLVYNNEGLGRAYGAEILLRHDLANRFFGWIAYTISRSERLDPGEDDYRLFDFDQTHILTALGSYNLPRNWSIGARFRLISGNPTTPIVGSVYDADLGEYERVAGESNSERLPAFHQLDVRIDKRWIADRWTANLYLDMQNVYNRKNAETIEYSYDFSESTRVSGLPFIPAIGFRMEW